MNTHHNTNPIKHHMKKKHLQRFLRDFTLCGLIGLLTEIGFTAMNSLKRRDYSLKGTTSLWMFPIYGTAAAIVPVSSFLSKKKAPTWLRGTFYMLCIYAAEFVSGKKLRTKKCCPWDYRRSRLHINGLIRLDYAPWWFLFGLAIEKLFHTLHRSDSGQETVS